MRAQAQRASVSYLAEETMAAIGRQIEKPEAFVNPLDARKRAAGITVIDNDKVELLGSERKQRLEQFHEDRKVLSSKLEAAGVSPLAFVPVPAWDGIVDEAGLYQFRPSEDGTVLASTQVLTDLDGRAQRELEQRPLLGLVVGALALGSIAYLTARFAFEWPMLATIAVTFIGVLLGAWSVGSFVESLFFKQRVPRPEPVAKLETNWIREALSGPHDSIISALWPDRIEPQTGVPIAIDLPEAPETVHQNLSRAHSAGFDLVLEVVPEAIGLITDPVEAFVETRRTTWKGLGDEIDRRQAEADRIAEQRRREFAERMARLMPDPIVTTTHGSCVAVIAQYGDFPIEQAVIERVVNSAQLI